MDYIENDQDQSNLKETHGSKCIYKYGSPDFIELKEVENPHSRTMKSW